MSSGILPTRRSPITRAPARGATALVVAAALTAGLAGSSAEARVTSDPRPGSTGSGDSLFPQAGNGGYDARHYDVALSYRPADNAIDARTRIVARARHPLSSFSLDLQGLRVRRVVVDGRRAAFRRDGHELLITPAAAARGRFTTIVRYAGHPHRHVDPDQSSEGWIVTHDGATTLNEPVGAMTWFPSNNTPRDKATYTVRVTAPSRLAVAGNGVLARRTRHGDRTTWVWRQDDPMATYLSMISIGDYRVRHARMRTASGAELPLWSFVDRQLPAQQKARRLLPRIIRWAEHRFGPYPFRSSGLVAHKLSVGYALETQDRPVFPGPVGTLEEVHELVHQWYGDSVTLRDWGDIWLNEGFATYAEWLWRGSHGGPTPAETFRAAYDKHGPSAALWSPAPAALTDPADLFGASSYLRGAMTLQVLRERVGTVDFFRILRSWARVHRHGGASTAQLMAMAERISGKDLDRLFQDWLYTPARPKGY